MHREYRALGLNSRGMALTVFVIGLLFSPVIVGIPLLVWGMVADHMLVKHKKTMGQPAMPSQRDAKQYREYMRLKAQHGLDQPEEDTDLNATELARLDGKSGPQ